jgi:DNA repair ATPase RecN
MSEELSKPEITPELMAKYQEAMKQMNVFREKLAPMRKEIDDSLKTLYTEKIKFLIEFEGKDRIVFSFDAEDKTPIEVVFKVKRTSL